MDALSDKPRILLVCTGNTCRSPMAEGILRVRARAQGMPLEARSAGVMAMPCPASVHAVLAAQALGADITEHQARRLDAQLLAWADLILTMTQDHAFAVLQMDPAVSGKLHTLCGYIGQEGDVPDPFGGDLALYQACAQRLDEAIGLLLTRLRERGI